MKLENICNQIYVVALNEARIQGHEFLTPEHFLYASLMFDKGKELLVYSGGDVGAIQADILEFFKTKIPLKQQDSPIDSFEFVKMFEIATNHARKSGQGLVHLGSILAAMLHLPDSFAAYYMQKNGVDRQNMAKLAQMPPPITQAAHNADGAMPNAAGNSPQQAKATSNEDVLEKFTTNMVEKARLGEYDPLISREDALARTIQVLSRRMKNNPVHVGEPGVGKTAIVEGIAMRIAEGCVPRSIANSQIFYIDMGTLLAGTKYRGDFEERLIKVVEAISRQEAPIIYIDEIHTLVGAGAVGSGAMDAGSILKPYLTRGKIRFIGSTTYEEYKKYFEKDRALSRRFQKIDISEPGLEENIEILKGLRQRYEQYHNVKYSDEIIRLTCELAIRYMPDRFMPDKAIDILDEAAAQIRIDNTDEGMSLEVATKDIERTVALMARIPEKSISGSEIDRLLSLENEIKKELFGQDEAVETVVSAIKASRSGLNDGERPVASLLFVGPTGVGKTEIAKLLAKHLNLKLLRYDMSEYQEKHSVSRLIGSPPGYVGYDEGGLLTEAARKTPHAVLLLDEIEKAHPDIYNVLLQIMDYGSLTDNSGKKSDFRNIVLIMTSNAGARGMGRRIIGYGGLSDIGSIDKEVERIFSPEFRNRLDATVRFNKVDEVMARLISQKVVESLGKRLAEKNIRIKLSENALEYISSKGFSEEYGAREIIRTVEREIKKELVDKVLFSELPGGQVYVDYKAGKLKISTRKPRATKTC